MIWMIYFFYINNVLAYSKCNKRSHVKSWVIYIGYKLFLILVYIPHSLMIICMVEKLVLERTCWRCMSKTKREDTNAGHLRIMHWLDYAFADRFLSLRTCIITFLQWYQWCSFGVGSLSDYNYSLFGGGRWWFYNSVGGPHW